ncbi:hypothetical protein DPEC_G00172440 [Dallia pectoralis]|uniref:Uncharacterized protein n=1 Tax=Dallia pectoralis TaxID=75939 RepID=A0ACC2GDI0_DALPE|nr:hypothetical protein DPEC_G00172440 [Dallia pectoralis]
MSVVFNAVFFSTFAAFALAFPFPYNGIRSVRRKGAIRDLESSASGPVDEHEPIHGTVNVVKLNPRHLVPSSLFRRGGLSTRGAPEPRLPFPAFLAMGRPGSPASMPPHPLSQLQPGGQVHGGQVHGSQVHGGQVHGGQVHGGADIKKRHGFEMWQRAMDKKDHRKTQTMSLPLSLKDTAKQQTCAAVPFTQRITSEGCDTATVHNKLCFGQCSSLFVPPGWESAGRSAAEGYRGAPCSRCAPSKAHTVTVPLRCGTEVRERRVMVVEECKCESGREEAKAEAASSKLL